MRYATSKMKLAEREEIYRVYVTRCLKSVCGMDADYYEIAHGQAAPDFDPEQVVDSTIERIYSEE